MDAISDVNVLMRAQHGALHHRQARALGMSERRIAGRLRTGAWQEAHPHVYVAAGAPSAYPTRCAAALLAVRHGGRERERRPVALAGLAAAWLHGLDVPEATRIDVIVPFADAETALRGVRVIRARTWPRRAFTVVDGLTVTSVEDTLVDIGALVPRDTLHALMQAASFGRTRLPAAVLHACRRGRRGSANARRAAALVAAGVDSSLHARGLALLRAAGARDVECGVEVVRGAGASDCVLRPPSPTAPGIVVEWDGDAHRLDRQTFLHDREKDRLLRAAGYVTLRYTWEQVRHREPVVTDVRAALGSSSARTVEPVRPSYAC